MESYLHFSDIQISCDQYKFQFCISEQWTKWWSLKASPHRTFLASRNAANAAAVEEEQPVCKSERETETLSIAHNISSLVSLERIIG